MRNNPYLDLPDDDPNPYLNLPDDNKIEPAENIVQKAIRSAATPGGFMEQGNDIQKLGNATVSMMGMNPEPARDLIREKFHGSVDRLQPDNPILGTAIKVGGEILGTPGNPLGKGIKAASSATYKGVKKGAGWFSEPWQNASKIDKLKSQGMSDIAQEALKKEAQTVKVGGLKKQVSSKLYGDEPMASLESETDYLEKSIPKAANKEALRLQEEIPLKFRQKSAEFGSDLKKLVGDKPILVPSDKVRPAIENALLDQGVLRFNEIGDVIPARVPMNAQETKLVKLYTDLKSKMLDGNEFFDAAELLKADDVLKVPFGKAFTKSDMLMSNVKRNLSGVIEDNVPGLKELRSSHAPFLKGKYAAIRELNPFSNEYNTGKAASFIEKYAKGKLDPDEKNLVGFLENELGRTLAPDAKAFGNRLSQSAARSKSIQTNLKEILSDIDRTVDDSITKIKSERISSEKEIQNVVDKMIRENNLEKWKRKGIGIGVGAILSNTILSKIGKWYSGKPNE